MKGFTDMKRILFLLSLLLTLSVASARDAQYQVVIKTNVMVPMRDGVKLATDLYLPAKDGAAAAEKFPPSSRGCPTTRTVANSSANTSPRAATSSSRRTRAAATPARASGTC